MTVSERSESIEQILSKIESATARRKIEHLLITARENVEAKFKSPGFDDIDFIHKSLPEINKREISLETEFFGKKVSAPIIIVGMTGGHPDTKRINEILAKVAQKYKIPIGVGSQRAGVENSEVQDSFKIVREMAPDVPVIGNIGGTHIQYAQDAIDMINADVLAVHLNPLQEAVQPEGDVDSTGMLDSIKKLVKTVKIPVIAKETGAGISCDVAASLVKARIAGIDVGGAGGTSWSGVEVFRSKNEDQLKAKVGNTFWDWGIPTAVSIVETRECGGDKIKIIGTGGIRSGIDAAKAIALGADYVGIALPFLRAAIKEGQKAVEDLIEQFMEELRVAMYLTGNLTIEDLKEEPILIFGKTRQWLEALGYDIGDFSRRYQ